MAWSDEVIRKVWNKGHVVDNNDPAIWRKDDCGAWIRINHYGSRDSQYGWEVDHINPHGSDDLPNLRPLQWKNNSSKQDSVRLSCPVRANGVNNYDSSET